MNPTEPTQPFSPNDRPTQPVNSGYAPNTPPTQVPTDPTPNTQAGYEWLANYNNQPADPQKDDSFAKKLVFVIIVVLVIAACGLGTVLLLNKSSDQPPASSTTQSGQKTEDQAQDSEGGSNEADTKRKDKLKALQEKLELYYAAFGHYPTFDDVTSTEWLRQYGVTQDELTDPVGNQPVIKRIPTSNYFSYQPNPDNCDNSTTKCTQYTISAVLENAIIFALKNASH